MTTTEYGYTGANTTAVDYTGYSEPISLSSVTVTGIGVRWKTVGAKLKIGITDGTSWFIQGEVTSTVDGWNDVSFSPTALDPGTYYIAYVSDSSPSGLVYSDSGSNWFYNNNTLYKFTNYANAFDVASQGTPIIKDEGSQIQNVRITTATPSSGSLLPPPIAWVNV